MEAADSAANTMPAMSPTISGDMAGCILLTMQQSERGIMGQDDGGWQAGAGQAEGPARDHVTTSAARTVDRNRVPRLAIESLLIMLSVLLGFAANQWHDRRAERALAAQALESFRHEIKENLATLEQVQPKHLDMSNRLKAAAAVASPNQTGFEALYAAMPPGGISVPPLSNAAWETATSTGALRLIGYDRAARLSAPYHVQTTTINAVRQRIEDRLTAPENFDPSHRQQMLRAQSLLFLELSGVETYLAGLYREALKVLDRP